MLKLNLPYPISANAYWGNKVVRSKETGRLIVVPFVTHDARKYKRDVTWIACAAGVRRPIEGRVHIHIDLYPKRPQDWQTRQRKLGAHWDDSVQSIDVDNARKVLYDALKGVAFGDDKWVWSDSAKRCEPDGEARVIVTITPIVLEQPQGGLDFGFAR
jgi:crossover junction endodeoxyribonuclease RusA